MDLSGGLTKTVIKFIISDTDMTETGTIHAAHYF